MNRARVMFAPSLKPHAGGLAQTEAWGARVDELLADLEHRHPGLRHYLVDDRGALRPHVNIFVDGVAVRDRRGLSDTVREGATVQILQALSGG